VVGAAAQEVRDLFTSPSSTSTRLAPSPTDRVRDLDLVDCPDWAEGMGASLRAGLGALIGRPEVDAVLITLVDLPDVGADVVRRVLERPVGLEEAVGTGGALRARLSRAAYGGVPGHPTLIGRDHWEGVVAVARGDRGARDYFRAHPHALVECGDLATGRDVDSPADLDA
jgi:CTP:molybdopterin cytidylyltransferase MocA